MTQPYEGMFLLDNQAVRADWSQAKSTVTELLAKHGAAVKTARRWDERPLAYAIKGRKRATYLLTYFEQDGAQVDALRHDLDIEERVLRYLILSTEAVPEGELAKSQAELEAGFSVPPPPTDDEPQAAAEAEESGKEASGNEQAPDQDEGAKKERADEKPTPEGASEEASSAGSASEEGSGEGPSSESESGQDKDKDKEA